MLNGIEDMPLNNVQWIEVDKLTANDYNPNVVLTKELQLLQLSLLKNGWIQPVLITKEGRIIDGFHRSTLCRINEEVRKMTDGKVPCVVLDLSPPERIMLTVRINRAKGNHIALKMNKLVQELINDYGLSKEVVAENIGATPREVELLLYDDVFDSYELTEETLYSQAWKPTSR